MARAISWSFIPPKEINRPDAKDAKKRQRRNLSKKETKFYECFFPFFCLSSLGVLGVWTVPCFDRLLASQNNPGHQRGGHSPGGIIGSSDPGGGNAFAMQPHYHRLRRQLEPGDRVKNYKKQSDNVHNQDHGVFRPVHEALIALRPLFQGVDLEQSEDDKPSDEQAAQFAQDESEVRWTAQPPVGGGTAAIPTWMIFGVDWCLTHDAPRGRRNDLNHDKAALSL